MYLSLRAFVFMFVCVCVCVCMHAHTHVHMLRWMLVCDFDKVYALYLLYQCCFVYFGCDL